jgi:glyoxylase-like metal-dependent hydrolase (beta-lactamase superfamily II)
MKIESFFDAATGTISYLVIDSVTKNCAAIDPVLDYDQSAAKTGSKSADQIINFIQQNDLNLQWILETHIHADHLTAASYLKEKLGGKIAISEGIFQVLEYWLDFFAIEDKNLASAQQFDHIFKDEESFKIGNLPVKFIKTAGHTPACGSYLIKDAIFVGDLIFMPNLGSGRADFPAGDAGQQFDSIQKIFSLPDDFRIFTGHDYPKDGQEFCGQSSVLEQKTENIFAKISDRNKYIKARNERDAKLPVPKLLLPAIQINLNCGQLPESIKIPLNKL